MNLTRPHKISNLPDKWRDVIPKNYDKSTHPEQYEKIRNWAREFHEHQDSLCLIGRTGTGKTHLAVSVCKFIPVRTIPDNRYYSDQQIYSLPRITFQDYSELQVQLTSNPFSKERMISDLITLHDVVILDDVKLDNLTEAKVENLALIVNRAYNWNKRLVITANLTEKMFEELDERVYSRLREMCQWVIFTGEDYRKKIRSINGKK